MGHNENVAEIVALTRREVYVEDSYGLRDLSHTLTVRRVVDVGYNCGFFSKLASEVWPDAEIIGIEPADDLPNHGPVVPVQAALSSVRSVRLHSAKGNLGARWVVDDPDSSIPGILPNHLLQWGPVDLLKLDCEGGERTFFRYAEPDDWKDTVIVGEIHRSTPQTWESNPVNAKWLLSHTFEVTKQRRRQFEFRLTPR